MNEYDDVLKSPEINMAQLRLVRNTRNGVMLDVAAELDRAIAKHGLDRCPANPDMDPRDRFIILMEEVGEVAETLTYDKQDANTFADRDKELVQVAAMAIASLIGSRLR